MFPTRAVIASPPGAHPTALPFRPSLQIYLWKSRKASLNSHREGDAGPFFFPPPPPSLISSFLFFQKWLKCISLCQTTFFCSATFGILGCLVAPFWRLNPSVRYPLRVLRAPSRMSSVPWEKSTSIGLKRGSGFLSIPVPCDARFKPHSRKK